MVTGVPALEVGGTIVKPLVENVWVPMEEKADTVWIPGRTVKVVAAGVAAR
jgi:hypothetical protein